MARSYSVARKTQSSAHAFSCLAGKIPDSDKCLFRCEQRGERRFDFVEDVVDRRRHQAAENIEQHDCVHDCILSARRAQTRRHTHHVQEELHHSDEVTSLECDSHRKGAATDRSVTSQSDAYLTNRY